MVDGHNSILSMNGAVNGLERMVASGMFTLVTSILESRTVFAESVTREFRTIDLIPKVDLVKCQV